MINADCKLYIDKDRIFIQIENDELIFKSTLTLSEALTTCNPQEALLLKTISYIHGF